MKHSTYQRSPVPRQCVTCMRQTRTRGEFLSASEIFTVHRGNLLNYQPRYTILSPTQHGLRRNLEFE